MVSSTSRLLSLSIAAALLAACGSGDSGGGSSAASSAGATTTPPATSTPQKGSVSLLMSDASTEDWATIGVKVLSVALVPQGGGGNVTVYTAATPAPTLNLAQLDGIADLLGTLSVPVGTYTGAVLTVSGNPSDILLTVAADPEAGFTAAAGTTISTGQIQVQNTQGSAATLTVPIDVNFATPLTVSATGSNAVDIEFDLGHPAFIVGHVMPGANGTFWAVNFNGPVHHHPLKDLSRLVLRHAYGDVTAIATDNTSITIAREFPTEPVVDPETAMSTSQSLQISADATNGTLFYDVDAKTRATIKDFSTESSLVGKSVRIAARYNQDGSLTATRIWASANFSSVWFSPEGHVLHVTPNSDVITVQNESGVGVDMTVNANTEFFVRQPQNAAADATPVVTGTGFLTSHDLARGFKVHASVVDPLATPLVAQTVEIETARYDGTISAATDTSFTYTRNFHTASDDYVGTLDYIDASSANGFDANGNAISGYQYWNFAYPTLITDGSAAIGDFVSAVSGSVNFGGSVGAVPSHGITYVDWNDPANPNGWAAAASILTPATLPLGAVAAGLANDAFTMTVNGGTATVTVDLGVTSGSGTLVYRVDRNKNIVTVTAVDVTTSAGLTTATNDLTSGVPLKVYCVPQSDGTLKAYVITYFTGDLPTQ